MWLVLEILAALALSCGRAERPLVTTTLGELEGVWQTSAKGMQYAAFMGIPYAQPPVGDLRFEPPEEVKPWEGVWDAGDFGPFCMTYEHVMGPRTYDPILGQEDCLSLNIYTPKIPETELKDEELMDVIVFIHGGAFMFGRSCFYGAKYFMDRKVIFVTINYRVGPLGFLSFEDEIMPGNNGMRDQIMALKWINKHIRKFGGNPKSVTLMGNSAGGASVHYHFLSPLATGLYKNGISMSGTATAPWALVDNAREKGLKFASSIGCSIHNGTEHIMECLKQRPAERLLRAVGQFLGWQYSPFSPFGPVIERKSSPKYPKFLHDAPLELMKTGQISRLPWMVGIVNAEGIYPVGTFIADEAKLKKFNEEFDDLAPLLLDYHHSVDESERLEVTRKIRKEYFGDMNITKDLAMEIVKMTSDRLYVVDAQNAAKVQAQFANVYFYKISFRSQTSFSDILTGTTNNYGVSHGDEQGHLMNVTYIMHSEADEKFSEMMLDLWTSFARFELMHPVSEGVKWSNVDVKGDFNYLNLDGRIPANMALDNDMGNAKFWTSLPIKEETQRKSQK